MSQNFSIVMKNRKERKEKSRYKTFDLARNTKHCSLKYYQNSDLHEIFNALILFGGFKIGILSIVFETYICQRWSISLTINVLSHFLIVEYFS